MTDRIALFQRHLAGCCLDIRQLGTARVYDQKVTPDVTTAIAGVVASIAPDGGPFSVKSVWHSREFQDVAELIFSKPSSDDALAKLEYDKFVGQPLLALRHAGVLSGEKIKRAWEYRVASAPILQDIASSEIAALDFLAEYAMKILDASGVGGETTRFFERQDKPSLGELEEAFDALILGHTNIRKEKEIGRIFPKMLNILSFKRKSRGRIGGHLSRGRITLYDIRYNRVNWRDGNKPKEITRRGAGLSQSERRAIIAPVSNVTREVKAFHNDSPEIMDSHSGGGVVDGHHIFPQGDYPELATVRENIILLTPTQHRAFAHAGKLEDKRKYQLLCLLRKLDAVEKCEADPECNFYSMSDFIGMLVFCGILDAVPGKKLRHKSEEPADGKDDKRNIIHQVAEDLRCHLMRN